MFKLLNKLRKGLLLHFIEHVIDHKVKILQIKCMIIV